MKFSQLYLLVLILSQVLWLFNSVYNIFIVLYCMKSINLNKLPY